MKLLAKLAIFVILSAFVGAFALSAPNHTATAYTWEEFGEDIGGLFDDGSSSGNSLTFVQYGGELGQLDSEGLDPGLTRSSNLREFILTVVDFALGFLGLVAVIIIIYAGVMYVTAGGVEDRTANAKRAILYATVGLLIVMGSFAFVNTVIDSTAPEGGETGGTVIGGSGGSTTGARGSGSFNASASQVRSLATEIYNGFSFVAETTEDFKNIQNDANKDSIYYRSLPARAEMVEFLNTAKAKLTRIASKVQNFSEAEAEINDQIRAIDLAIDLIQSIGGSQYVKVGGGDIEPCGDNDSGSFGEGFDEAVDGKNNCEQDGFIKYDGGKRLLKEWQVIIRMFCKEDNKNASKGCRTGEAPIDTDMVALDLGIDVYDSLNDVARAYYNQLDDNLKELEQIWDYVSVISSVESRDDSGETNIEAAYNDARSSLTVLKDSYMDSWSLDSSNIISNAAAPMIDGVRNLAKFYDGLIQMEFVRARLTADVIEGNAPLTVIFDTFRTEDPAGGSVKEENIKWDISGKLTLNGLYTDTSIIGDAENGVICDSTEYYSSAVADKEYDGVIGKTAQRCTFNRPGSYQAAVLIESNEPTTYGPGLSVLNIQVNPPATEINLKVYPTSTPSDATYIMRYVDNLLSSNRSEVTFTLEEAESGITFDASETKNVRYKWSLGDGDIRDFSTANATVTKSYKQTGIYEITLEVANDLGTTDRKSFRLKVDNVSARIKANPDSDAFINSPVTFDGSGSRSDVGGIRQYEWEISKTGSGTPLLSDSGPNLRTLTYQFEDPGSYDIRLSVTNDSGEISSATLDNYLVKSKPPVAQFDYEIPNENQPATVELDAFLSYDPDGDNKNLIYEWEIDPDESTDTWLWEVSPVENPQRPVVRFLEKGDYKITLKVIDEETLSPTDPDSEESDSITKTITIDDLLDIAWNEGQPVTANLDAAGEAELDFAFNSENAIAYEINFGDNETDSGNLFGSASSAHTYREAGTYRVELTVFDEDDNDKTITRRIFIGGGDEPLARITVLLNDSEVSDTYDEDEPIVVTRKDILKFDAGKSINTDGTGRKLRYSWDFGDTGRSSEKIATHKFNELSPDDPGYFEVTLRVTDSDDATLNDTDTVRIRVVSTPPRFSAIQALPVVGDADTITPVNVVIQAFNPEDPDGRISQYKWWYFDIEDPENPLGVQITERPTAQLIIGTRGAEGAEKTYGFGLEVTDNDNLKFSSTKIYEENYPTVTVINGPNDLPTAKFSVDSTKTLTGESIRFTSSSTDTDGKIISYVWDIEGDGFFNNEPTEFSTIEHTYSEKNLDGYDVRLKVIDDKGGESISEPLTIFVDSLAKDPVAAFKYQVVPGSGGKKIKFINNSTADDSAGAEIIRYEWDFDTRSNLPSADSDGDGLKDNDIDSKAVEPERLYTQNGSYVVRLTITDNQGNTDTVQNTLTIPLANPPKAAFTYDFADGKVVFQNNSTVDTVGGAKVAKYIWDFDTASELITADSDGDGLKDNDEDSTLKNPDHEFKQSGTYQVKLTVVDDQGNQDSVTNPVAVQVVGELPGGDDDDDDDDDDSSSDLKAVLLSSPAPGSDDIIYLSGESGTITFNFSKSEGLIAYYTIDKNILFDTDGNGIKNDDNDFKTVLPGTWKTNFAKEWGKTVVKLTVVDIYGNSSSITKEVKFK